MRETLSTRSAAIELADEGKLMRQGYRFLDEKRMLLAGEMLRQLGEYQELRAEFIASMRRAAAALAAAVERHGLDDLQAYPCAEPVAVGQPERTRFLGLPMLKAQGPPPSTSQEAAEAVDASPEAKACRTAFERLVWLSADLGLRAGNLLRLTREYRRTERRARTLEKVLLPEVDEALRRVNEQLEMMDREELIRTRWSTRAG
jgi:V/A-type H+/Na+-transporting ATPase subunit D